jgi:hypothetical protein
MSRSRRQFLKTVGLSGVLGVVPQLTWADAGAPAYLSAAREPNGRDVLCGLSPGGDIRFKIPLPGRGHAAAAHPYKPVAVAFARRPGVFAVALNCAKGDVETSFRAPVGRHFYGHGAFSANGDLLFTTENDFESGQGRIGVWDALNGFRRVGEFKSGGIGPHEIVVDHVSGRIVVANGGIQTHPDSGRTKLNLPFMRPNLAYLDVNSGAMLDVVALPGALRMNSLRHVAIDATGRVAVAAQWQGDVRTTVPLLATHQFDDPQFSLWTAHEHEQNRLKGYGGSVAFSHDGNVMCITAPRGDRCHVFDLRKGALFGSFDIADVCGVAPVGRSGLMLTDGRGGITKIDPDGALINRVRHGLSWDNHLVSIDRFS